MTQDLLERTTREWVLGDTARAARDLNRLARKAAVAPAASPEELVDALVRIAGRLEIAQTRAW